MKNILKAYEEQLQLIEERIDELRLMRQDFIPTEALNLLCKRIDTLVCEKYELMQAIVMIRKYLEPKETAKSGGRSGDAA